MGMIDFLGKAPSKSIMPFMFIGTPMKGHAMVPIHKPVADETQDGGMGDMRIMATIYIEIYSVGRDDERFWTKYAILSAVT